MKKKLLTFMSVALFLSVIAFPGQIRAASSLSEINKEIQQLEQQKSDMNKQQKETNAQIQQITHDKNEAQQEISYIMNVMDQVAEDMNKYQGQIDTTQDELRQIGQQLDDAQQRVSDRDQLLREKLRLMYMNGFVKYVDVLVNAKSFADFLDRFNSLTMIVSQDKSLLEAQERDRDLIEDKQQESEKDLASLKGLYTDLESKRQDLQSQEKKKEVLIASLSDKQQALDDISQQQQQQIVALAAKEAKLQAEKRSFTLKSNGKFNYPLPHHVPITSGFGSRIDPITGKKGAFHNGYDLGATKGTDVLATADGEVLVAGWVTGFGNCIIIDHGSGIWSLYGHMLDGSLQVKKGQTVKQGQVIGHVGMTGRATGYHLHFTIYKDQVAVDPSKYVNFD